VTPEQIAAGSPYALGANVYQKGTKTPALPEYAVKTIDGVRVAFIGTVTTDTARMVDPQGIKDIDFGDQLEAANRVADKISNGDLADVTVLLTHSGSSVSNQCDAVATDPSDFGTLIRGASSHIDAIVSAHTHQTYACNVQVGSSGKLRPVIQAAEYGKALGQLSLTYDTDAHELVSATGSTQALAKAYPADAAVASMVAAFTAQASTIGSKPVGAITADILRGGTGGSDRGVESTMGNTVADIYLWATSTNPAYAGTKAQIALMNPGGLRADLLRTGDGTVTFKELADVQPFANTLVTVTLTGAQLKDILTRQWQSTGDRPKLHLGVSKGFTYEYTEDAPLAGQTASRSGHRVDVAGREEDQRRRHLHGGDELVPRQRRGRLHAVRAGNRPHRHRSGRPRRDARLRAAVKPMAPSPVGRAVLVTTTVPTPDRPRPRPTGSPSPTGADRCAVAGAVDDAAEHRRCGGGCVERGAVGRWAHRARRVVHGDPHRAGRARTGGRHAEQRSDRHHRHPGR
jgi:5'-nucleotidase